MQKIIFFVIFTAVLVFLFFIFSKTLFAPGASENLGKVCFKGRCFLVELAKTETQREKGLMFRRNLDRNSGMFFIFDKEGIHPFWMKNTLIPLDIIWFDGSYKVVFISRNVQPCKGLICPEISPSVKAKYVLELNAGIVNEINLTVGDGVEIIY